MTGAEILLICILTALAAGMGWFAARLTADEEYVGPTQQLRAARDRVVNTAESALAGAPAAALEEETASKSAFVAVIKFPSFHRFRQVAGDETADAALAENAARFAESVEGIRVHRTGNDTIDCELLARSEDEAVKLVLKGLGSLAHDTAEEEAARDTQPLAGIVAVNGFPASQAAFDAALRAVSSSKSSSKQVVVGHTYQQSGASGSTDSVIRDLREALKSNAVSLAYQPKLNVRTQSFHTAEALFRWDTEKSNHLNVGEVIVLAEQYGIIDELTLWAIKRAVTDQLALIDHGIDLKTFVNLSGNLISDSEFTLQTIEIMKGVTEKIGLEITETSVIEHAGHALANLELYSAAGAEIAIDDYGTGLSSLRYLKRIPAQELKIDREFVKDLTSSHRDPMIVRSTIDLAHALGMKVTAEGVDCPTKLALLKVMGCDQLQGFHIAKPMPLTDLIAFMKESEQHLLRVNANPSLLPQRASSQG